jgi:CheY-like chemotaxis protein
VDDDDIVRDIIQFGLEKLGYAVSSADSGRTALEVAAQNKDLQLLLTDVLMPGMNGVELAERVRKTHPDLRVLYVSGHLRATIEIDSTSAFEDYSRWLGRILPHSDPSPQYAADNFEQIRLLFSTHLSDQEAPVVEVFCQRGCAAFRHSPHLATDLSVEGVALDVRSALDLCNQTKSARL